MIDVNKGRYWDFGWQLIDGCTPCSPGCDNCWSAARAHRFFREGEPGNTGGVITDEKGKFNGAVITYPERLNRPLKRKKPAVYAIWNDLFHEDVPTTFIDDVFEIIAACPQHTFLILTKRAHLMEEKIYGVTEENGCRVLGGGDYLPNAWLGLTVCTQQEWEDKGKLFMDITGNKFLSLEPMLGEIDLKIPACGWKDGQEWGEWYASEISAVIVGGETGPKARPMHPDCVRSVKDQCQAAGVPFFFKGWGEWFPRELWEDNPGLVLPSDEVAKDFEKVGRKKAGRILDGVTHDDLPWNKEEK